MSRERVGYIIGLLGYTKVCSRWVPRMLTLEKKQKRVESGEEHLKRYCEEGDQFLLNIVTGDVSWIHHFDPVEKRLSMQNTHTSSPRPKKFKTLLSAGKILLTAFWDSQKVYMTQFLEDGNIVNSAQYIENRRSLQQRVCRVRRSTSPICCCMTMQDRTLLTQPLMLWRRRSLMFSPIRLQPSIGAKRFPFLSSPQEGSQGDSFHLR